MPQLSREFRHIRQGQSRLTALQETLAHPHQIHQPQRGIRARGSLRRPGARPQDAASARLYPRPVRRALK